MAETIDITLPIPSDVSVALLVGPQDEYLHLIEDAFTARITVRGDSILLHGQPLEVQSLTTLFSDLIKTLESGHSIGRDEVKRSLALLKTGEFAPAPMKNDVIISFRGRSVRPKTLLKKNTLMPFEITRLRLVLGQRVRVKRILLWRWQSRLSMISRLVVLFLLDPLLKRGKI